TCSSDQKLKVWDANDEDGKWVLNDTWKGHDCSILKVTWAHPEYGQAFASCSFDRMIKIWEEVENESKNSSRRWAERARLAESRGTVQDIEFCPNNFGLKLASCASDGVVRIYEALDVVNLSAWTLMVFRLDLQNKWQAFEVLSGHGDLVCDVAWAPNMGRSYQLIATASKDHHVRIFKLTDESARAVVQPGWQAAGSNAGKGKRRFRVDLVGDFADHGAEVWRVEWNVTGTILSSSGDDGKIRLWKATQLDEWRCLSVISAEQRAGESEGIMR
ncbi:WD40-repeat-containing domain protein, partial [Blyttiomyces helicus]